MSLTGTEHIKGKTINFSVNGVSSGEGIYIMRKTHSAFIRKEDIIEVTSELSMDTALRKVFLPHAIELGIQTHFYVTDGMGSSYYVRMRIQ